jgi:hypothetical protein
MNDDTSITDILNTLAVSNIPTSTKVVVVEEVGEYDERAELAKTLRDLDDLIRNNAAVMEEAKRLVETTGDAEYLDAYSSVGKAQSEAIKNKVKILTEKEKNKIAKETKERELDIKEKLTNHTIGKDVITALPAGATLNQTNVIMSGSREEMFEMILKMQEKEKINVKTIEV